MGQITGEFEAQGNQLSGTIHNNTLYDLSGVVLILGSEFVRVPIFRRGRARP